MINEDTKKELRKYVSDHLDLFPKQFTSFIETELEECKRGSTAIASFTEVPSQFRAPIELDEVKVVPKATLEAKDAEHTKEMVKKALKSRPYTEYATNKRYIVFQPKAFLKLYYMLHRGNTEVGGMGVSKGREPSSDLWVVEEISMPKQYCSGGFVDFDMHAWAKQMDEYVDLGKGPYLTRRIWIHTHPGNSPNPSGTDENTFREKFGECSWAMMYIMARGGDVYCRVRVETELGQTYETYPTMKVDWAGYSPIEHDVDIMCDEWDKEYKDKVFPLSEAPSMRATSSGKSQLSTLNDLVSLRSIRRVDETRASYSNSKFDDLNRQLMWKLQDRKTGAIIVWKGYTKSITNGKGKTVRSRKYSPSVGYRLRAVDISKSKVIEEPNCADINKAITVLEWEKDDKKNHELYIEERGLTIQTSSEEANLLIPARNEMEEYIAFWKLRPLAALELLSNLLDKVEDPEPKVEEVANEVLSTGMKSQSTGFSKPATSYSGHMGVY